MSLETDLYVTLSAICPRVYPDAAPNGTARPYITWQQLGGSLISPMANVVADKRCAFIQVNVWSSTRAEANTMALQIEQTLTESSVFIARAQGAFIATYDEDTELRGTIQDFTIWAPR